MREEGWAMAGQQVLELINMQVQTREVGKIAVSEVVVVHQTMAWLATFPSMIQEAKKTYRTSTQNASASVICIKSGPTTKPRP